MAIEMRLPELGEGITGGEVVNILVKEGDTVSPDQTIMEVATDKAVVPVPAEKGGKIAKLHVKQGENIDVGSVFITIGDDGAAPASAPNGAAPAASEAPAPAAKESGSKAGASAAKSAEAPTAAAPAAKASSGAVAVLEDRTKPVPAGPAARRLAREFNVDLGGVKGSGPRGRITPDDVIALVKRTQSASGAARPAHAQTFSVDDMAKWGPIRTEAMSKIRRTIAAHMVRSKQTIPHVTNFDDADITELERIRKGIDPARLGANVKLTSLPFVMKAIALSLKAHPLLNASYDEVGEQIIYKDYVHIGVAVDTPRGLVVPVIRDVDKMTIPEIARSLASVAERARAVQFTVEDLRGGSFTVSNLGAVGGKYSTPVINYPEAAILLLGRGKLQAVVLDDKIEPRMMLPLSLSYDHRLVDGAEAGRFLNEVIGYLQSPGRLLLAE